MYIVPGINFKCTSFILSYSLKFSWNGAKHKLVIMDRAVRAKKPTQKVGDSFLFHLFVSSLTNNMHV